jgi:hypothetical protein
MAFESRFPTNNSRTAWRPVRGWAVMAGLLLALSILSTSKGSSPFLYFNFWDRWARRNGAQDVEMSESRLEETEPIHNAVSSSHWARMLRAMAASLAGVLLAVAGTHALIDPKGLYQIANVDGFNAYKPFQNY